MRFEAAELHTELKRRAGRKVSDRKFLSLMVDFWHDNEEEFLDAATKAAAQPREYRRSRKRLATSMRLQWAVYSVSTVNGKVIEPPQPQWWLAKSLLGGKAKADSIRRMVSRSFKKCRAEQLRIHRKLHAKRRERNPTPPPDATPEQVAFAEAHGISRDMLAKYAGGNRAE